MGFINFSLLDSNNFFLTMGHTKLEEAYETSVFMLPMSLFFSSISFPILIPFTLYFGSITQIFLVKDLCTYHEKSLVMVKPASFTRCL